MGIKVRFAPSPTGNLHVGGLRTALYNYLYARKVGGKLILRIEDTDQTRKVDSSIPKMISTFKKLNIQFDEGYEIGGEGGPYLQSKRLDIYHSHIQTLLKTGYVYPCFCSSVRLKEVRKHQANNKETIKYDRYCLSLSAEDVNKKMDNENYVIRMKVPSGKEVVFYDAIRNRVAIQGDEIDDQILIKSDGYPTYHFANVVDDHLMGITHVIRGEEWLSSTPKHILLYQYFHWDLPQFIHLPLLLNPDKSKLSKRQGDVAVEDYLNKGFLPDALINFVALLGWHPQTEREIFSLDEIEKEFSIKRIQKSGAIFDKVKLEWMNSHYLRNANLNTIAQIAKPYYIDQGFNISDEKKFLLVIDNARKRVSTLNKMLDESRIFYNNPDISKDDINLINTDASQILLKSIHSYLSLENECTGDEFKALVLKTGGKLNMSGKNIFFPLRTALFGNPKGPDIPLIFTILGRDETLNRLTRIIL